MAGQARMMACSSLPSTSGPIFHLPIRGAPTRNPLIMIKRTRTIAAAGEGPSEQIEKGKSERIAQTLTDLDAMLGIVEEPEKEEEQASPATPPVVLGISPEVLKVMAEAEADRARAGGVASPENSKRVNDSIGRVVEQARRLSKEAGEKETVGEEALRSEFEKLLSVLTSPRGMDQEEIKLMKDKVFGANTFWVTETEPILGFEEGIVVRGNFRGTDRVKIYAEICSKIDELFGGKYLVKLVEEREWVGMEPGAEPRVVLQIMPTALAQPPPTAGWQRGVAGVLIALTLGSAFQLGLAANLGLLSKEALAWLSDTSNLDNAAAVPPDLDALLPWMQAAVKVGGTALVPQLAHELGHSVVAGLKGIKTAPSFLIPNSQLGTFGSITQFKSLVKNRTDLFDHAAAGLVCGGAASLALFVAGLAASANGGGVEAGLLPVPVQLFQGSLLLGGLVKAVLGADAMAKTTVFVSPLMVGGWCGLVTTALNALPVGNLDGGRTMLAAYGRGALSFGALGTYIGLGLGILGSSLSLPFGLYVLICQRESERNLQDEVNEIDDQRKAVALAIAVAAVLVLLPGIPDAAEMAALTMPPENFL